MGLLCLLLFQVSIVKVLCDDIPFPLIYSKSIYPPVTEHLASDSLFGYSAAYQSKMKKFIIGAPRSNKYGLIFLCDDESFECYKNRDPTFPKYDNMKNHGSFYLGANIVANSDFYMSCAPRSLSFDGTFGYCFYQNYTHSELQSILSVERITLKNDLQRQIDVNNGDRWGSFTKRDLEKFKKGLQAFPQEFYITSFGWSIEITKTNSILVGGPAGFSGRAMLYHRIEDLPVLIALDNEKFRKSNGSVLFNFGYSVTSGEFFNNQVQYAISTPYGDIGEGKILLFDETGSYISKTIVDDGQVGALFGASIASANLDGVLTYLLVGAPTYSQSNYGDDAQLGAVKIYKPVGDNLLLCKTIIGFESEGYFGLKVAKITDVNNDNIDDIVISAPFEKNGRGAIYIYSGADLISSTPKILQKDEGSASSGYYGLSVTLIEDFDQNGCNEIAVGEPGSNLLKILRCISTVDVELRAEFPDLRVKSNIIQNDGGDNFIYFRPCIHVKHPDKPVNITTQILVKTTLKHPHAKISGINSFNTNITEEYCGMIKIKLPKDGNYDRPLQLDVFASIINQSDQYDKQKVRLSEVSKTTLSGLIWGVGSELQLQPIETTLTDGYLIGSTDTESITVSVVNLKNIAHQPCVHVNVYGASIIITSDTCKSRKDTLTCSPASVMYKGSQFVNKITLDTKKLASSLEMIAIKAYLLSDCETTPRQEDPNFTKHIEIRLATDIQGQVTGESIPSANITMSENNLLMGDQIKHVYKIDNKGMTTWTNVKCQITLPSFVTTKVLLDSEPCPISGTLATCTINQLPKNNTVIVFVTIIIPPNSNMKKLHGGQVTTSLDLLLNKDRLSKRVTTIISLDDLRVPIWIIALAAILGLIILVFIFFILKECGCFRRKNKEKLLELKREVKRQSMRRSVQESLAKMEFRKKLEEQLKLIGSQNNLHCEEVCDVPPVQKKRSGSNESTTRAVIH